MSEVMIKDDFCHFAFWSRENKISAMIRGELLEKHQGRKVDFPVGSIIFHEGDQAHSYFQIITGEVKMSHFNEEGKEFVQRIFSEGESFGEPPLLGDFTYPSSAITLQDAELWKLDKTHFIELLRDHPDIHLEFTRVLSRRLRYKAMMQKEIATYAPRHRILTLIDHYKEHFGKSGQDFEVPFTRQQLADMTGLRVETVIRAIKELEQEGALRIIDRKVHR